MKNKEKFERTYSNIYAPEALVWKVMDMSKEMEIKKFKTRNVVKYVVSSLAIMLVTFMASNVICYATTGESLVTKIKVTLDGVEKEQTMEWRKIGDVYQGSVTLSGNDGSLNKITITKEAVDDIDINLDTGEMGSILDSYKDAISLEATFELGND